MAVPFLNKRIFSALFLAVIAVSSVSCGSGDPRGEEEAAYEIDRVFRRGPVDFRIAVSDKDITIADRIDLLLEARADEGYTVDLPSFGEKLQNFGIVDYRTFEPELGEGGETVKRRVYELEPFLSGEYTIPPMSVAFKARGDTLAHYVESDSIKVNVRSILPDDMAEMEIRDIAPPEGMPREFPTALAVAAAVLIAAVTAAFVYRARKRKRKVLPPPAAHEVALARLQRLLDSGLVEERKYIEFTIKVSDVLRHYIEDRFGLRAPERTTEEFLEEARSGLPTGDGERKMLEDFLAHCDLVKFAAFEPTGEDVQRTFDSCRDFIMTTKIEKEVSRKAA